MALVHNASDCSAQSLTYCSMGTMTDSFLLNSNQDEIFQKGKFFGQPNGRKYKTYLILPAIVGLTKIPPDHLVFTKYCL